MYSKDKAYSELTLYAHHMLDDAAYDYAICLRQPGIEPEQLLYRRGIAEGIFNLWRKALGDNCSLDDLMALSTKVRNFPPR